MKRRIWKKKFVGFLQSTYKLPRADAISMFQDCSVDDYEDDPFSTADELMSYWAD